MQSTRSTPSSSTSGSRPASLGYSGAAGPRPITQSELATALALASTPESSSHTPTPGTQVQQLGVSCTAEGALRSSGSPLSLGSPPVGLGERPPDPCTPHLLLGSLLWDLPDVIQRPVGDTHHQRPLQPGLAARPAGLGAAQPAGQWLSLFFWGPVKALRGVGCCGVEVVLPAAFCGRTASWKGRRAWRRRSRAMLKG